MSIRTRVGSKSKEDAQRVVKMTGDNEKSLPEVDEAQEKANSIAAEKQPDSVLAAADSARLSALKARKRTKTGCLSKSRHLDVE